MKQTSDLNNGFSLVEIILYISLLSLLLLTVLGIWQNLIDVEVRLRLEQQVQDNSRFAIENFTHSIHGSDGIQSPAPGATSSVLQLSMLASEDDPILFDEVDGIIEITKGITGPFPVTQDSVEVSDLVFTNLTASTSTPGSVRVQFLMTAVQPTAGTFTRVSKFVQSTATLRNGE